MPETSIPLAEVMINSFPNSFNSAANKLVNLCGALEAIRSGIHAPEVHHVRHVLHHQGKAAYDRAKAHLQALTFGGRFWPTRGIANLQQHSGIAHGDLDDLPNVVAVKQALAADPRTVYVFISPSGTGLKVGVHVPVVPHDAAYKHTWHAVATAYQERYGAPWDPSGKDVSRLCFVSDDPQLYRNLHAECFDIPPPPLPPIPEPWIYPTSKPSAGGGTGYDPQRDVARALHTATQMIQAAQLGTRHHTRLKAAKLLGGYVGAGLLSETEAYDTLAYALEGHTEHINAALKTVKDGLAYGRADPFSLSALEADWQRWMDAHQPATPTHQAPIDHDPWEGTRTLPLKPYQGLRLRKAARHG